MGDLDLDLLSGQGLKLGMTDFYIHIHVHFVAKETGFPWISTAGTAEIYAHHASVTADIDIGEANAKPTVRWCVCVCVCVRARVCLFVACAHALTPLL